MFSPTIKIHTLMLRDEEKKISMIPKKYDKNISPVTKKCLNDSGKKNWNGNYWLTRSQK